MPTFPEQPETANNRDAEKGLDSPRATFPTNGTGNANGLQVGPAAEDGELQYGLTATQWLALTRNMKGAAEQNLNGLRNIWATNYRAINNQHAVTSKYNSEKYRGRSQLHRPKVRTAVKKADAGAANALFATSDVVNIEASNPLDPKQQASAEINKALLNYRLDRKSGKAGMPWFQIAVGAHNDSVATGLCISKQYWEYREVETGEMEEVPQLDEMGQPMQEPAVDPLTAMPTMDPTTQQPVMKPVMVKQKKMKVIRDRPMARLYPPDLVLRDPGSDWLDQAQESSYIGLMNPVTIGDFETMTREKQTKTTNMQFLPTDRSMLTSARIGAGNTTVNSGRESGNGNQQRQQISTGVTEFDRIWLIEWFVKFQGREYVYWTAGSSCVVSKVVPVEVAYPEQRGERPIVIGVGNLEPHKIDPMSMVQSVMPLQMEMNEIVNMRMDGVKDSIRPLAMVKKGKNIDVKAIQHRSGDSAIYVTDKEDVTFDRPGSVGSEAYTEMNYLNSDFDDATGQFNGGSVTTNRELGKTVGGLNLLNSNANIVGDFDLRVWIETYIEPVLRQIVKLEQFYEDDETILQIAGQKAKLYQKFGVTTIDDDLLERELNVSVNAGIGNADPQVKMDKFIKAGSSVGTLLGPAVQARANQDAVINEVFGAAGFRDAAERFFKPEGTNDPEKQQLQQTLQQLQTQMQEMQRQIIEKQSGFDTQIQLERIKSATHLLDTYLQGINQHEMAETNAENNANTLTATQAHDNAKTDKLGLQKKEQMAAKPKPGKGGKSEAKDPEEVQGDAVEGQMGAFAQLFMKSLAPVLSDVSPGAPAQPAAPQPDVMQMLQQQGQQIQQIMQTLQALVPQRQAAPAAV